MNDQRKEIEAYAKALAELQILKSKQRDTYRRARSSPGITEALRAKAWLKADPDSVNGYADPSADGGIRFELPEGWPAGTDPKHVEYSVREMLWPDEAPDSWLFADDEEP